MGSLLAIVSEVSAVSLFIARIGFGDTSQEIRFVSLSTNFGSPNGSLIEKCSDTIDGNRVGSEGNHWVLSSS
jgi:hypothetical protein